MPRAEAPGPILQEVLKPKLTGNRDSIEVPSAASQPVPPEVLFTRLDSSNTETATEPAAEITEPVKVTISETPQPVVIDTKPVTPEVPVQPVTEISTAVEIVEKSEVEDSDLYVDNVPAKAEKTEVILSEDINDTAPQPKAGPEQDEDSDFDLHQIIEDYRTAMEFTWGDLNSSNETASEPGGDFTPELSTFEAAEESDYTKYSFNQTVEYVLEAEQVNETYEELASLWLQEQDDDPEVPYAFFDSEEGEIELRPLPQPTSLETEAQPNVFVEFIAQQPTKDEVQIEEPVTLKIVQQKAEAEQPAEVVLVELVHLIESQDEQSETADQPQLMEIKQLLSEIHQEVQANVEIVKPPITPELTHKLLTLMEKVGYQDPQKALLDMANRHGVDFLMQAMEYLYQLTLEENRYEFASRAKSATADEDSASVRLGKAILKLIHGQPELQAV